ncbi:D-glycero-beta-D-manno-heptose 1-phosphate adenylyltransferase [Methylobacterium sp. ID0610]|uniref:D-glycero-beta-D-manno-heptose 1-phosphate adenylyltransferase n=1 Tax=Methylobacterium carpenticola TaxID=3344827 RepID=UPI003692E15A
MTTFPKATSRRILVVGDAMIDRYVYGEVTRISPEAPVPVLLTRESTVRAGGAANVAANIAAMGGTCELLAAVGDDDQHRELAGLLAIPGLTTDLVVGRTGVTTEKTRIVSGRQHQIARVDRESRVDPETLAELERRFGLALDRVGMVVLSDYGKGVLEPIARLIALARARGVPVLVDPKIAGAERYRGTHVLKPNGAEYRLLFGACPEADLPAHALAAIRAHGIDHLVLTNGPAGMITVSADGRVRRHPTRALEVYDVSGAGDTVLAALAVALGAGEELDRAVDLANLAAGIAVSHAGTYVVTARDIAERLGRSEGGSEPPGIPALMTLEATLSRVQRCRATGGRVVFTNGCFDILHPGHVRMLRAARAEGDLLVVGLNSDASVARLKGPERPVNTLADRAEVLAALATVDCVVGFEEDTPRALVARIEPDVLVKGGDYAGGDIVGADIVRARGGRVVTTAFHAGHSSTATMGRIRA